MEEESDRCDMADYAIRDAADYHSKSEYGLQVGRVDNSKGKPQACPCALPAPMACAMAADGVSD